MSSTNGFSRARLGRMSEVMRGYVDRGEVAGVVALLYRHGEVHVDALGAQDRQSGTAMRRDTLFRVASMTKPVTAAAALILVEETKLRLDDPVDRWLPELADRPVLRQIDSPLTDTEPAKRPISVRDLLTFRLGLGAVGPRRRGQHPSRPPGSVARQLRLGRRPRDFLLCRSERRAGRRHADPARDDQSGPGEYQQGLLDFGLSGDRGLTRRACNRPPYPLRQSP